MVIVTSLWGLNPSSRCPEYNSFRRDFPAPYINVFSSPAECPGAMNSFFLPNLYYMKF